MNWMACLLRRLDQSISGIGNQWRSGIRGVGNAVTFRQQLHHLRSAPRTIMIVVGNHSPSVQRDPVNVHQLTRLPSVLANQHVCMLQHTLGANRDIVRIPDGRRNQPKPGLQSRGLALRPCYSRRWGPCFPGDTSFTFAALSHSVPPISSGLGASTGQTHKTRERMSCSADPVSLRSQFLPPVRWR